MPKHICEQCRSEFTRDKSGDRPIRFCSQKCYHTWRKESGVTAGQFKKDSKPWNKNLKGIHLSPETEFKKGGTPATVLPVGTLSIRIRNRDLKPRAFVKVAEPNVWRLRCRLVWEDRYGEIPKGLVIHHIDRDTLNDEVINLAAVSRAWHINSHRDDLERGKK